MALLCHGLGLSCGARCLHMLPLITTHRSNLSRKIGQVPLKEPLGASLVKHEESWVCWENMKSSDWPNAAQAPSFLMPSSATHNASNTLSSRTYHISSHKLAYAFFDNLIVGGEGDLDHWCLYWKHQEMPVELSYKALGSLHVHFYSYGLQYLI